MEMETLPTPPIGRDWVKFLKTEECRTHLEIDLINAREITHNYIINGEKRKESYKPDDASFMEHGVRVGMSALATFFHYIYLDRPHFDKFPDMAKRFADTGNGWKFQLNEEEWMEVRLV